MSTFNSPMNSPRIRRSTSSTDSILDRDPEDLKKEEAQYRSIGYLGIVFIVTAVICVAIAVPQIMKTKDPALSRTLTEAEKAKHDEIHDFQKKMHDMGKSFNVECLAHGSEKLLGSLPLGATAEIICPSGCENHPFFQKYKHVVWGTKTYVQDSFVCMAALHSTGKNGGKFSVSITAGLDKYEGSDVNGVHSDNDSARELSFTVEPRDNGGIKVPIAGVISSE